MFETAEKRSWLAGDLLFPLTIWLLFIFFSPALAQGEEIHPRFRQGYLSSPHNAFLLTGICEKYAWLFPIKGKIREYTVESLHLGNSVRFTFNDDASLRSCFANNFELAFSYRDGRIDKSILYHVSEGELDAGIESVYRYFSEDSDRVEVWSYNSQGEKTHQTTYLLDGFELTIINERLQSETVKTFDHLGRLVEEKSDYARVVYDYDDAGYIVLESSGKGGEQPEQSKIISYSFAADGNIAQIQTKALPSDYLSDYVFHITK